MKNWRDVQFGSFGDIRDDFPGRHLYQPEGSKKRYEMEVNHLGVTAKLIGKPDKILPGGRAGERLHGVLSVWGGNRLPTGDRSDRGKEILTVEVRKGARGKGVADAMLHLAHQQFPDLSHSASLSAEGARFANRNPLPGDHQWTKEAQTGHLTADAATAMLGGPRRSGYV